MRTFSLAAGLTLLMGVVASASKVDAAVYDQTSDFASIAYNPAGTVAANRQIIGNMFDNDAASTMLSLGLGGNITFNVQPGEQISSGSIIEITFQSNHSEAADLYLGGNKIATLKNEVGGGGTASVINHAPGTATVSASNVSFGNNTAGGSFTLTVLNPLVSAFSSLQLVDVTTTVFSGSGSDDGFDIGEFRLTTVPVPAAVVLFGSALAGLGVMRRRRTSGTASATA